MTPHTIPARDDEGWCAWAFGSSRDEHQMTPAPGQPGVHPEPEERR